MRDRVVCIVGPTASGKTALALALASRFGAEIVSADSRQIYRGLDIGTAKPTLAEQARARHHCLDLIEPGAAFDAARFRRAAADAIADIRARGRVPFVVGGTGLYVRALLGGLCPAPPRVPALRAALDATMARDGLDALYAQLVRIDPDAARRLAPRDRVRIVRALEVALATGVPLSRWQAEHGFRERPYETLVIGLARPTGELDARIRTRVDAMVASGFVDEPPRQAKTRMPATAAASRTAANPAPARVRRPNVTARHHANPAISTWRGAHNLQLSDLQAHYE